MRFKTGELEVELWQADARVIAMALYIDKYARRYLGKDLMVTDVGRSQHEYDAIYAAEIAKGHCYVDDNGEKHYAGPRPHLANPTLGTKSRAVDFRTVGELNEHEINRLVDHANAVWVRRDRKPTAIYHDVGAGAHLHIQSEPI